jgi:hypothetical protein
VKKYFALIALWVVTIATLIGGLEVYKAYQSSEFDKTAIPYIRSVIPELSKWDPDTARALMTPDIAATIPEEKFTRAMLLFARLGALQSMDEPEFRKAYVDQETDIGKQTIVEYEITAQYENDAAIIFLALVKKDQSFEIYRFNLSAEILLAN